MNYFFDTEFIEDGRTIELISIGIVSEDGREFYVQAFDAPWEKASEWVNQNVMSQLRHQDCDYIGKCGRTDCPWLITGDIGDAVCGFVGYDPKPIFWAYYADYDWVALCQLYGRMIDLPKGWPMYCRDLRQWLDEHGFTDVKQPDDAPHNALEDARWVAETWKKYRI